MGLLYKNLPVLVKSKVFIMACTALLYPSFFWFSTFTSFHPQHAAIFLFLKHAKIICVLVLLHWVLCLPGVFIPGLCCSGHSGLFPDFSSPEDVSDGVSKVTCHHCLSQSCFFFFSFVALLLSEVIWLIYMCYLLPYFFHTINYH